MTIGQNVLIHSRFKQKFHLTIRRKEDKKNPFIMVVSQKGRDICGNNFLIEVYIWKENKKIVINSKLTPLLHFTCAVMWFLGHFQKYHSSRTKMLLATSVWKGLTIGFTIQPVIYLACRICILLVVHSGNMWCHFFNTFYKPFVLIKNHPIVYTLISKCFPIPFLLS